LKELIENVCPSDFFGEMSKLEKNSTFKENFDKRANTGKMFQKCKLLTKAIRQQATIRIFKKKIL
jgi:hypothetical protein